MNLGLSAMIAAVAVATSTPSFANDPAPSAQPTAAAVSVKAGQVIRDADGRRIGVVDSVRDDQVMVITDTKIVRVAISTVRVASSGLKTSLKSSQLR